MKILRRLVTVMLMVGLAGCGGTQAPTPTVGVEATATPGATPTPFTLNISPLTAATDEAPNTIDQENQRISDEAFSKLSGNDSFRFDLTLTVVYDAPPDHFEFVLKGNGAFSGLDQASQPAFMAMVNGALQASGKTYQFTADTRFVGRNLYLLVTATNSTGETRSLPWAYIDIDQPLSELTSSSPLLNESNTLPDSAESLSAGEMGDFIGLLDFSHSIATTRLADEAGGVIHFLREIDVKGLLSSREFLQINDLLTGASGTTAETLTEEQINQMLPILRQQLDESFPTLDVLFHQFVNPNETMNRLAFEADVVAQNGGIVNVNAVINFSNHGDTIRIEAPADAVPLETLKIEPFEHP